MRMSEIRRTIATATKDEWETIRVGNNLDEVFRSAVYLNDVSITVRWDVDQERYYRKEGINAADACLMWCGATIARTNYRILPHDQGFIPSWIRLSDGHDYVSLTDCEIVQLVHSLAGHDGTVQSIVSRMDITVVDDR